MFTIEVGVIRDIGDISPIPNILKFNTNVLNFLKYDRPTGRSFAWGFRRCYPHIYPNMQQHGCMMQQNGCMIRLGTYFNKIPVKHPDPWVDITFRFRCWFLEIPFVIHSQIWKYARKWSFLSKKDFTYKLPKLPKYRVFNIKPLKNEIFAYFTQMWWNVPIAQYTSTTSG